MRFVSDISLNDIRLALRNLRRHPSSTWSAIAVLALGVGAVTAMFSVLECVLLSPLPYREPHRLALLRADLPGYPHQPLLTTAEYFALRDRTDLFDGVAAMVEATANLTTPDDMAPLTAAAISDNFLDTLGVRPLLGRSVSSRDAGSSGVTISHGLWQRHFQGDPGIVGRRIDINNTMMLVVGVLPPSFRLHLGPGVRVPPLVDVFYARGRGYDDDPFRGNVVVARLRPDLTRAAANAAVDALAKNDGPVRLSLDTVDREVTSDVRPALLALTGAVAFVLVTACANLANLLLARVAGRSRELAIRVSIGASRRHLTRQFLAEGLVLGACGGIGGVMVAHWSVRLMLQFAPAALPRRDEIVIDGSVLLFALAVSLLSALAVSSVPLWHALRADIASRLKQDAAAWQNSRVTRGALIVAQISLSVVLLAGFGLLARAFVYLSDVPLGFEPNRAASMYLSLHSQRFGGGTIEEARLKRIEFYRQLRSVVRDIPGVQQFGVGFPSPFSDVSMVQPFVVAPGMPERPADGVIAFAGFLEALQVPLVEGRYFNTDDDNGPVIVIDEMLAAELWPGQSAVGRHLYLVSGRGSEPREIVGVVRHVQTQGLRRAGMPQIWMTYASRSYAQLNAVVRAEDPLAVVPLVGRAAQELGSGRPVRDVQRLDDAVATAFADTRFAVLVLGVFGALAMLLAAVGVYGAVANTTIRRTREIAVRIALGAAPHRIVLLAAGETAMWTAAGLVAGILGATALTRYLESLLFEIQPTDALTFAAAAVLLALVAIGSATVPALRASRVDPMLAMRAE